MDKEASYYRDLLSGFVSATLDTAQVEELLAFVDANPAEYEELIAEERLRMQLTAMSADETTSLPERSVVRMDTRMADLVDRLRDRRRIRAIYRWSAAAAAVLVIGLTGYWYFGKPIQSALSPPSTGIVANDVAPGGNKATLTLGNGSIIVLDSARVGQLAQQAGATIYKSDSGRLAYVALSAAGKTLGSATGKMPHEIAWNVLATPRGGQYQLVLPDGTHVWLNAESSIKYPTAFAGGERSVEITGEAYFEVVHNVRQPFIVKVGGETIRDIGTDFNVNAYADEPEVAVTLLEGAVEVGGRRLMPGEQLYGEVLKKGVDIEQVVAWKNGLFNFNHADLPTVMRQLSRWYDIDIQYKGPIARHSFHGKITRELNLSQVLKGLSDVGIKFTIQGKTLTVQQ